MSTKNKEYRFSVTQVIRNFGAVTIEAKTIKEAKSKLKEVEQSSVDWYTDDYVEQMENTPLKFELESTQEC
jgi:hypothetical protein